MTTGMLELSCVPTEDQSREEVLDVSRILNKMQKNVAASIEALTD